MSSDHFQALEDFLNSKDVFSKDPKKRAPQNLLFILGPCVMESEAFTWEMAHEIAEICQELHAPFIFKASFDKANRSSVNSFRGPGLEKGCPILAEIGKKLQVPVTTDIHTPKQAEFAADFIDVLQIPAFLCRQTDLILAAGKAAADKGKAVNIKKGQFLSPWD